MEIKMVMKLGFIVLFVALITFAGCSDTVEVKEREPAIFGTVVDSEGNPVPDVDIVLLFDLIDSELEPVSSDIDVFPNPAHKEVSILVKTSITSKIKVELYDPILKEVLTTFFLDSVKANNFYINFNLYHPLFKSKILRNGIYEFRAYFNDTMTSAKVFVLSKNAEEVVPTTKSDTKGEFVVSYDYIQLYEALYRTFPDGTRLNSVELSDSVRIYGILGNVTILPITLKIDKSKAVDVQLVVPLD